MRAYPIDSPQAAARLLAMALVADGHFAMTELKALDRLDAPKQLGMSPEEMSAVIDTFCEELQASQRSHWGGSAQLDSDIRDHLLDEVRNPRLRAEVRRLCEAIVLADGHLADGEVAVMDAMALAWRESAACSPAGRLAPH